MFPILHVHSKTRSGPATVAAADEQMPLTMKGAAPLDNQGTAHGRGGSGASKSNSNNGVKPEPAQKATKMRPREGQEQLKPETRPQQCW